MDPHWVPDLGAGVGLADQVVDCLDRIIIWSKRKEKTLFALDKDTW